MVSQVMCSLVVGLSGQCQSKHGQKNSHQPNWIRVSILHCACATWETTSGKGRGAYLLSFYFAFILEDREKTGEREMAERKIRENKFSFNSVD